MSITYNVLYQQGYPWDQYEPGQIFVGLEKIHSKFFGTDGRAIYLLSWRVSGSSVEGRNYYDGFGKSRHAVYAEQERQIMDIQDTSEDHMAIRAAIAKYDELTQKYPAKVEVSMGISDANKVPF